MKATQYKDHYYNIEGADTKHCGKCRHVKHSAETGALLPMCDISGQLLHRGARRQRWCKRNEIDIGIVLVKQEIK